MSISALATPAVAPRPLNVSTVRLTTVLSIVLADAAALVSSAAVSVLVRYHFHGQFRPSEYVGFAPAMFLFFVIFAVAGLYPGIGINPVEEFRCVLKSASVGFLVMIGIPFFLREDLLISRLIYIFTWLLSLLLVPGFRHIVRNFCSRYTWWGVPTVIFGQNETATSLLDLLSSNRRLGLRPIAVLCADCGCETDPHILHPDVFFGTLSHSNMFAHSYRDAYAVLTLPNSASSHVSSLLTDHATHYRKVLIVSEMFDITSLSVTAKDLCGRLVLEVNQHLSRGTSQFLKRMVDCLICVLLAPLLAPLFILLYLTVVITSEGPAFYSQTRIGRAGKEFRLWKFRSMVQDADRILERHLLADPAALEEWRRDHKLKRDLRVTPVGRFLRKTSLDELPQLWNVIRGEMSLVGPRPIVAHETEKYGVTFRQYCRVSPGITGLWQISGRNNTTYEQRTQLDDYYVRNWSVTLDLYILCRTMKTVLTAHGAY